MRFRRGRRFALAGVYVASVSACGGEPETGEPCRVQPGDLVISEIMANPLGDDGGKEWFEILNTSTATQPLGRVVLERLGRNTDGSEKLVADHAMKVGSVAAGQYFVLGGGGPIDYLYNPGSDKLGDLNNTSAGVRVRCRGEIIDTVWYGEGGGPAVQEGKSLSLDGGLAPDARVNDQVYFWCAGVSAYDADGNLGTPGAANDLCGLAACREGEVFRATAPPLAGDLVISEMFADAVGADAGKEWLEVYVAAGTPVDLNGLSVVNLSASNTRQSAGVTGVDCVTAQPGQYMVIGAAGDKAVNGGVAVNAVATGLALFGTASLVELFWGGGLIDSASLPASRSGVSLSLDPQDISSTANDVATHFCDSKTTTLFNGAGTPGQANDLCGVTCSVNQVPRLLKPAAAGDLVIIEIAADPAGADTYRDWFEVYVAAGTEVDLNGVRIENENLNRNLRSWTLSSPSAACLTVQPGTYAVIAGVHPDDPNIGAAQDGVSAAATFTRVSTSLLYNQSARLTLKLDGTVLDTVGVLATADPGTLCCPPEATAPCTCCTGCYPGMGEGATYSLGGGVTPNPIANDDDSFWCRAQTVQGAFTGGLGSPGLANDACP